MSQGLFGPAWVRAWRERINSSEEYRAAAATWNGTVGLRIDGDEPAAIVLELERGTCRSANRTELEALGEAGHVLRATHEAWRRILEENKDPVWALMSGKIQLERGSMGGLLPYAQAARELLACARGIDATETDPEPETAEESSTGATRSDAPSGPRTYRSTDASGLDRASPPMRLWKKAKVRGIWNPSDVDFTQDARDWQTLTGEERDLLMRLTSLFLAGEEAVTLDLLPLIQRMADDGRIEDEIFLTSFLWEEAKHVDAFSRFFDELATDRDDLTRYHSESYRAIFYDRLPAALRRLRNDGSPEAVAEASVTYHMVVEGVLAETGYHGYATVLDGRGILPGTRRLVAHIQSDEARHLAYGVFLLSRLVAENGEELWRHVEERMEELLPLALSVVNESFAPYDPVPFDLSPQTFADFAQDQFQRRYARIEKARRQTLAEVYRTVEPD